MQSWANRNNFHQSVTTAMAENASDQAPPILTDDLKLWLAQLTLLYGVPIEYLVPDYRMLPVESIRFFYLDRNWLDRLVDGAMSVGVLSTKEMIFNKTFFKSIYQQVDVTQQQVRSIIRDEQVKVPSKIGGTISGLLFRSQVVTDYPGIEINAYDESGKLLPILRMDRLSNSLLLCIFNGVPDNVEFIQPSEGLHFGIQREKNSTTFQINLRGLGFKDNPNDPPKYPGGKQIDIPPGSEQYQQATGTILTGASEGVIDIMGLVKGANNPKSIEATMASLPKPNPLTNPETGKTELTPGGFAIQMVVTAGRQAYKIKTQDGKHPPACEYPGNNSGS